MISVQHLHFSYNQRTLLNGVTFAATSPQMIGIIGPNGSGKSTLLKLLAGICSPVAQQLQFKQHDLLKLSVTQRAKLISYLPQFANVHWPLSVRDVVNLGRLPHRPLWSPSNSFDDAVVTQVMQQTDVLAWAEKKVLELSGGELARVMLARMLATQAQLLLLDEPVANLDLAHQHQTLALLKQQVACGATVLTVMHDINLAAQYCDRLLVIKNGSVLAYGVPSDVLTESLIYSAFSVRCQITMTPGYPHCLILSNHHLSL